MASYIPSTACHVEDEKQQCPKEEEEKQLKQAIVASLNDDDAHQLHLDEAGAFSDEVYSYALQLQEVIFARTFNYVGSCSSSSSIAQESTFQYVGSCSSSSSIAKETLEYKEENDSLLKRDIIESSIPVVEELCGICLERKTPSEVFSKRSCCHSFCHDCIAQHVLCKLREKSVPITCPEPSCRVNLSPEECESILPKETVDAWCCVLVEANIPQSQRFYCPFRDCSALLLKDDIEVLSLNIISRSECPVCRRLFCAQCGVPWHADLECDEFQRMDPSEREQDDLRLFSLTKQQQWQRCPQCKMVVERTEGCPHMSCRCGCEFCYTCGSARVPQCRCTG